MLWIPERNAFLRTSGTPSAPPCPVCRSPSLRGPDLPRDRLARALEEFVEEPLPAGVALRDYAMRACAACTLEFAEPMAPADDAFYAWLDRRPWYYVAQRWEWNIVEARIAQHGGAPAVLEFGAGDAKFLRRLRDATGARVVAIERSSAAVAAVRAGGIEAYTAEEAAGSLANRGFDFVIGFHTLEHVADPLALALEMVRFAGAGGQVLVSVPYSPMYFESRWFDPLNHPPHHLTRWNARSLAALAGQCGRHARLRMPAPLGRLARARYALAIGRLGPHWSRRRGWRLLPLLHPLQFMAELGRQGRRDRVGGRAAADVVLVELLPISRAAAPR
jgi:SAM-dependent methyltransferase